MMVMGVLCVERLSMYNLVSPLGCYYGALVEKGTLDGSKTQVDVIAKIAITVLIRIRLICVI